MIINGQSIILYLVAVLLVASVNVQARPLTEPLDNTHEPLVTRSTFRDDFASFDTDTWSCEYTCPVIKTGKARFRLKSGVEPDNYGSWSKARYRRRRFTSGRFTASFSLTARPKKAVWWGVALWDDGKAGRFNEINFGYTTDQSYTNTQLRFESARKGKGVSLKVDTGVDLYDGKYHTATLEYSSKRVALYLDGKFLKKITDRKFIPTAPMDFLLGPRLITGEQPLKKGFTESINWVEISV
ncbi:hypothetical protein QQZ08_006477 [Neonectria magnoliae]|uniref:GH16 domain-containing protein n=1 Tax=Neonectria magnoliae TaxID=2732573 RepID=A0ABR1I0I1_9HYPO